MLSIGQIISNVYTCLVLCEVWEDEAGPPQNEDFFRHSFSLPWNEPKWRKFSSTEAYAFQYLNF